MMRIAASMADGRSEAGRRSAVTTFRTAHGTAVREPAGSDEPNDPLMLTNRSGDLFVSKSNSQHVLNLVQQGRQELAPVLGQVAVLLDRISMHRLRLAIGDQQ